MIQPRNLTECRIDDNAPTFLPAHSTALRSFLDMQEALPRFGRHSQNAPDLVLIDVNFADDFGDPLSSHNVRPTGLLYGLCLLMWANVMNRPVGCAIHTADPSLWAQIDVKEETKELFVLLVGLVAAVTKDDDEYEVFKQGEVQRAVQWLEEHSSGKEPGAARRKAAEQFRKRLQWMADPKNVAASRLVVDPTNYICLLTACDKLKVLQEDTPVGEHELLQSLGVLVFIDGKPDCFAVNGLFPNVVGGLLTQDFQPSGSLNLESWRYDETTGRRPLVADYLRSLGQWRDVYEQAKEAAKCFGSGEITNEEDTRSENEKATTKNKESLLHQLINSGDHVQVTRFVAVAFGIVRLYETAWDVWCKDWNVETMLPWTAKEKGHCLSPKTKRAWLDDLLATIQILVGDERIPYESDIAEKLCEEKWDDVMDDHCVSSWLREYLQLLQAIGCVTSGSDEVGTFWQPVLEANGSGGNKVVPVNPPYQPPQYRPDWLNSTGLATSVGYGKDGNQFKRLDGHVSVPEGTLHKMANGGRNSPSWLIPLCEQYACDIGFDDKNGRPEFMRFGGSEHAT